MQTQDNNTKGANGAGDQNENTDDESLQQPPSTQADEDEDPALDEEDLEENDLTPEEADNIEWDAPAESDQQRNS